MQLFGDETSDQLILKSDPNIKRSQSNDHYKTSLSWVELLVDQQTDSCELSKGDHEAVMGPDIPFLPAFLAFPFINKNFPP